jgi:hypothetical protein
MLSLINRKNIQESESRFRKRFDHFVCRGKTSQLPSLRFRQTVRIIRVTRWPIDVQGSSCCLGILDVYPRADLSRRSLAYSIWYAIPIDMRGAMCLARIDAIIRR